MTSSSYGTAGLQVRDGTHEYLVQLPCGIIHRVQKRVFFESRIASALAFSHGSQPQLDLLCVPVDRDRAGQEAARQDWGSSDYSPLGEPFAYLPILPDETRRLKVGNVVHVHPGPAGSMLLRAISLAYNSHPRATTTEMVRHVLDIMVEAPAELYLEAA